MIQSPKAFYKYGALDALLVVAVNALADALTNHFEIGSGLG
jgi:hypothetical protein